MSKRIVFVYINRFKSYPIIYEYCIGLRRLGYEVHYIGLADADEHFISDAGVQVTHFKNSSVRSRWQFALRVKHAVRNIQPHLVHVFHFRWCFFIPLAAGFSLRFLLDVRTVHVANAAGKYTIVAPLKNRITWLESLFFRHKIALTAAIRKMLLPSFRKIPVFPLGANTGKFNPPGKTQIRAATRSALGYTSGQIVFIYTGTLNPARRIDVMIQAFAQLCKKNDRVRMVIAGDDKDNPATLAQLKQLSDSLALTSKIKFTGFLAYELLIEYSLACDIGLCYVPQTPFYDYQPPTKLFEYMAAGLLVITTRTKASQEIISDGNNGFLCNDDASEFAACMEKVAGQFDQVYEQMTAKAYESIKNYSWDYIVENYLHSYYKTYL